MEHPQEVAQRGAGGAGGDADAAGQEGQRPLARRVEQPLLLEPRLELLQLEGAGPGAAQLHLLHHQLVLAVGRVDLDEATGHHLEPLGQGSRRRRRAWEAQSTAPSTASESLRVK